MSVELRSTVASEPMDGFQDTVAQVGWDGDPCQLEGDRNGMTYHSGADLDQPRLQAGQPQGRDLVEQLGSRDFTRQDLGCLGAASTVPIATHCPLSCSAAVVAQAAGHAARTARDLS